MSKDQNQTSCPSDKQIDLKATMKMAGGIFKSQAALAEEIGTTSVTMSGWCNGAPIPAVKNALLIRIFQRNGITPIFKK